MSHLLITHIGDDDWLVWMTLPDHDPLHDLCGFVIGCGATRNAAVADAVADLEGAIAALQSPVGVVQERTLA